MAFLESTTQSQEDRVQPPPLVKEENADGGDINVDDCHAGTPIRYVSLDRVYSAASFRVSATSSTSKKTKPKRLIGLEDHDASLDRPPLVHVYCRRRRKRARHFVQPTSFFDSVVARSAESEPRVSVKAESCEFEDSNNHKLKKKKKRSRIGSGELEKLAADASVLGVFDMPRLRDCHTHNVNGNAIDDNRKSNGGSLRRKKDGSSVHKLRRVSPATKRWIRLSLDDVDPEAFLGLPCKVYWPLDADWYAGHVVGYKSKSNQHHVEYEDGDEEDLILSDEKVKFFISSEEMEHLNLSFNVRSTDADSYDYDEMVALAASLDDCQDLEPGDIIWAKLTGHAMWPAIVVDEALITAHKGLNRNSGGISVLVQFFGTHDFARIKPKQVISFLKGLLSSFHLKCKKPHFTRGLEEAKIYLSEQKLPRRMLQLQNGMDANSCKDSGSEDEGITDSDGDCVKDEGIQRILRSLGTSPYVIGDLQIISLGKIVKDSEYFQDDRFIWPEGYTALRKFTSIEDPNICTVYKMEVLRDAESKIRPLFRVTLDNGDQIKGSTPSACWNKIYKRMRKLQDEASNSFSAEGGVDRIYGSGSDMFGFSNSEVKKLIKGLSDSRLSSKLSTCKFTSERYQDFPIGYRPVRVDWKDLDKCSVCHMDEEYENNLFLQCDKCRMMVHARCYGELEPVDGVLWLCNLCRPGAPESPPPCCLCPVTGGAMKQTTDGRWAHLACAIWIPETCLSDVKRMEPIDGLNRINKDRWKLLCSICGVAYGACIQCSNNSCRVAYHALCARAAGLCVELEDEDRLHLLSVDDEDQCIRLLSFCKKHRQPSNERPVADERISRVGRRCSDYTPPCNPSGCARSEPYNLIGRRGRKEPAAASLKRLFVANQPYLVGGYCKRNSCGSTLPSNGIVGSRFSFSLQRLKASKLDSPDNILSMSEKYIYMRQTFRKRLTFGKWLFSSSVVHTVADGNNIICLYDDY
uniref:Histone-lysine N-methyltransferase ATX2 n=1 Tax=Rhizophora mucronata TaxID=61149 RepID=A0A2P2L8Y3_RHIMU